jgi:hypothetical protein
MTDVPKRAWLLPGDDCGIWKAENNGSAEMAGAVEYVPASEADAMEAEAHAHIELWGKALKERDALSARLAEVEAERDTAREDAIYNAQYVDLVSKYRAQAEAAEAHTAREVAKALEGAAGKIDERYKFWDDLSESGGEQYDTGYAKGLGEALDAIRALIPEVKP